MGTQRYINTASSLDIKIVQDNSKMSLLSAAEADLRPAAGVVRRAVSQQEGGKHGGCSGHAASVLTS